MFPKSEKARLLLNALYLLVLGALISIFVTTGIATFYTSPEKPQGFDSYIYSSNYSTSSDKTASEKQKYEKYIKDSRSHDRNVSIMILFIAGIIIIVGMQFDRDPYKIISRGSTLGGYILLFIGTQQSYTLESKEYSFMATTYALILIIYVGFRKYHYLTNYQGDNNAKHDRNTPPTPYLANYQGDNNAKHDRNTPPTPPTLPYS